MRARERRAERDRERGLLRRRGRRGRRGAASPRAGSPDVVVVDPPRAGLAGQGAPPARRGSRPPRIVYVSCNPTTLAANLKTLIARLGLHARARRGRWTCSRTRPTSRRWRCSTALESTRVPLPFEALSRRTRGCSLLEPATATAGAASPATPPPMRRADGSDAGRPHLRPAGHRRRPDERHRVASGARRATWHSSGGCALHSAVVAVPCGFDPPVSVARRRECRRHVGAAPALRLSRCARPGDTASVRAVGSLRPTAVEQRRCRRFDARRVTSRRGPSHVTDAPADFDRRLRVRAVSAAPPDQVAVREQEGDREQRQRGQPAESEESCQTASAIVEPERRGQRAATSADAQPEAVGGGEEEREEQEIGQPEVRGAVLARDRERERERREDLAALGHDVVRRPAPHRVRVDERHDAARRARPSRRSRSR